MTVAPDPLLLLADKLSPPKQVDPRPWVCDLDECDGEPHDDFTYKHARTKQRSPWGRVVEELCHYWLLLTGRGFGKSMTGANWLADAAWEQPNTEWAVVAPTFALVMSVCLEARSPEGYGPGLLSILREKGRLASYVKSPQPVITLTNGSKIFAYGAAEPERGARGRNLSGAWCDEMAAWSYREVWDEILVPALRVGAHPRVVITSTPKPVPLLREFLARDDGSVYVTRGSIFENSANLSPTALAEMKLRYEGTRLGRQELYGEMVEDVDGALWTYRLIDDLRINRGAMRLLSMRRVVVGVDPAGSSGENAAHTGIIVVGQAEDGHDYVLADYSVRAAPDEWAKQVALAFDDFAADKIALEVNFGAEMAEWTLRGHRSDLPIHTVRASKNKILRAEPFHALYERGMVHHAGTFGDLETEMCTYVQGTPVKGRSAKLDHSPDRLDALVWALTELHPELEVGAGSVTTYSDISLIGDR